MRRGTTPTLNISIDYASYDIATAWITIKQGGRIVIDKTLQSDGVTIEDVTDSQGNTTAIIHMTLTQEDTLALAGGTQAELQVRALMEDGKAGASSTFKLGVADVLKDGVITEEG